MLFYFILFCIIGCVLGFVVKNIKIALGIVVAISLCWAFVYGPWELATFLELMWGLAVARGVMRKIHQ